jgi:hypothetical protein
MLVAARRYTANAIILVFLSVDEVRKSTTIELPVHVFSLPDDFSGLVGLHTSMTTFLGTYF